MNHYKVLYVGKHTETEEKMAVYRRISIEKVDGSDQTFTHPCDDNIWIRPLTMWNERVEYENKTVERFTPID